MIKIAKNLGVRTPKGTLQVMIKEHTSHLKYDSKIKPETIKKRCTRKGLLNSKTSPVFEMEM